MVDTLETFLLMDFFFQALLLSPQGRGEFMTNDAEFTELYTSSLMSVVVPIDVFCSGTA